MRRLLRSLLLVGFVVAGSAEASNAKKNCDWSDYVDRQSRRTCTCLAERIAACKRTGCAHPPRPSSSETMTLVRLIDKRDPCAADLGFAALLLLSGGDLEDVMRAISGLSGSDPLLFLHLCASHHRSDERIRDLVCMLPLTTVDDPEAKRRVLKQRISSLSGVRDRGLRRRRNVAIDGLERCLKELR